MDVVDVLSAAPDGGRAAATVVTAVRVLSVPLAQDDPGRWRLQHVVRRGAQALQLPPTTPTASRWHVRRRFTVTRPPPGPAEAK